MAGRGRDTGKMSADWDGDRLGQLFSNLLGERVPARQPRGRGVRGPGRRRRRRHGPYRDPQQGRHLAELTPARVRSADRRRAAARQVARPRAGAFHRPRDRQRARRRRRRDLDAAGGTTFAVMLPRAHRRRRSGHLRALGARRAPLEEPSAAPCRRARSGSACWSRRVKDYAIFMLDPSGRVATWNAGAKRIKGYEPSEIIGQHFSRFYPEEEVARGQVRARAGDRGARGALRGGGVARSARTARRFWANVVITALRDAGRRAGRLHQGDPRPDRAAASWRRSGSALARAQEAIRLRDEFLSLASHELKTPLTVLQIQLDSLRSQPRRPAIEKLATKLQRAARSSDRLAAAGRVAARRLAHRDRQVRAGPKPFDLGEIVRQADRPPAPGRGRGRLRAVAGQRRAARGRWDQLRVEQVVTNLVANAIKYARRRAHRGRRARRRRRGAAGGPRSRPRHSAGEH